MGVAVKYVQSKSEAEILALLNTDDLWYDLGFYYPNDVPVKPYYYRIVNNVMVRYGYGEGAGVGVKLNGSVLGGVKTHIEENDSLVIPANHDYNTFSLVLDGKIQLDGKINFI